MNRWVLILVAFVATLALSPTTAMAAETLGSDLAAAPDEGLSCSNGCTMSQAALPGRPLVAAQRGVLVRWRMRTSAGSASQQVRLGVVRRDGANKTTGMRRSDPVAMPATAGTHTFDTRLRVDAGEGLALISSQPGQVLAIHHTTGARLDSFNPPIADGASAAPNPSYDTFELLINADIEPDVDTDVYGDETQDNCPGVSNPSQTDTDNDGIGDACDTDQDGDGSEDPVDTDDDGDGRLDTADNCPKASNADQADADGDGVGDVCDPDSDGDSRANDADNCPAAANPGQEDLDKDGIGDVCDPDVDGDGGGNAVDVDDDNDGVLDPLDNCAATPNPDQANSDGDGQGNACDPDDDNDGAPDANDNCATTGSPDQTDTDKDGKGNPCDGDDDADGMTDDKDNCPLVVNLGQVDSDRDGLGDECDPTPKGTGGGGTGPGTGAPGTTQPGATRPGATVAAVAQLRLRKSKVRLGTKRRLSVAVECRVSACVGTLRSRDTTGVKLALAPGKRQTLKMKLTAKAAKRLVGGKRRRVKLTFRSHTGRASTLTLTVIGRR